MASQNPEPVEREAPPLPPFDPVEAARERARLAQRRVQQIVAFPLIAIITCAFTYSVRWHNGLKVWLIAIPLFAVFVWSAHHVSKWREARRRNRPTIAPLAPLTAEELLATAGADLDEESEGIADAPSDAGSLSQPRTRRAPLPVADSLALEATVLDPAVGAQTAAVLPQFDDYEILAEIGRGGMGCVYKAKHKHVGRVVALKTVLTGRAMGRGEIARFQAEIQSAARLDHPGIVPVYEAGESQGQHYFTMAFVDGDSLADRIKRAALDPQQAVYVVSAAARAVAFAHRHGVIHRDLKPGNILLDREGSVRVADFGLARQLDAADVLDDFPTEQSYTDTYQTVARLTVTGAVLGTPAYMAPEQALDTKRAKEPADIWALGAVLYACLTGRPPFIGANAMDTLTLVIEADPPPLRQLAPQVDPDLEAICLKCLTKDPLQRYASTEEFVADLERWRSGRTPHAARLEPLEQWQRWDTAYPEVLPLATGLIAPWLCGVQEGIFLGTMLAASRLRCQWPRLRWLVLSGLLFPVLGLILRFFAEWLRLGTYRHMIPVALESLTHEWIGIVGGGAGLGIAWCIGSQAASGHDRRWTFHLVMGAALAAGVGLYIGFGSLESALRRVTDIEFWNYQAVWGGFRQFDWSGYWVTVVAVSVVILLVASIFGGRGRTQDQPLGMRSSLVAVAATIVTSVVLVLLFTVVYAIRPYGWIKFAHLASGPSAAVILVSALGFSAGCLLSQVLHGLDRGDDADSRQARFVGRVAASIAALIMLMVVLLIMPEGHSVELDPSGYFGPGPLLTLVEFGVAEELKFPVAETWPLVFLAKFVLLMIPMAMAAALASRMIKRSPQS